MDAEAGLPAVIAWCIREVKVEYVAMSASAARAASRTGDRAVRRERPQGGIGLGVALQDLAVGGRQQRGLAGILEHRQRGGHVRLVVLGQPALVGVTLGAKVLEVVTAWTLDCWPSRPTTATVVQIAPSASRTTTSPISREQRRA